MKFHNRATILLPVTLMLAINGMAQAKRAITAEDCVTVRYLNDDGNYSPLQINGQGTRLAYVVKSPNLRENRNDIQLYVKDLSAGSTDPGKLILVADSLSQLRWAQDGEHIFLLTKDHLNVAVTAVDVVTGERNVVTRSDSDIKEYTVDAAGDTIVFATEDPQGIHLNKPTTKQTAEGYRIPFQSQDQTISVQRRLFVTRRIVSGNWTSPQQITVRSPFTGQQLTRFPYSPHLSISPNGKELAFSYLLGEQEQLPIEWTKSSLSSQVLSDGSRAVTELLLDLNTMQVNLPFRTHAVFSIPIWASDSKSFALVATSPIGTSWEQADAHDHQDLIGSAHLFWIEPDTGKIEEIVPRAGNIIRGPLWWGPKGDMLVETEDNTVERLSQDGDVWRTTAIFRSQLDDSSFYNPAASDGSEVIREREGPATPPELVRYSLDEPRVATFAKLDPQFDMLTLAPAKRVEWETSSGYKISGLLLVPPDYAEGQTYPLVIQGYHAPEKFYCDYGEGHWPSLVPQPLADAGIMYLIRTGDVEYRKQDRDHRPQQYPGGIGEAALQMEIWDSAVKTLVRRGLIDPDRIGIIGYSRTGWFTEFTLTHSEILYAAATDTDNITYSLGDYFLYHEKSAIQAFDSMYGGPPYGDTFKNWLKYAPGFNIDKIHTPVLMEEMGYGISYDNEQAPPLPLISHFELFTGLNRLNKPVELYYYPLEGHTPDHPQARLASLQRNVDWYRFWLQGYERPNPEDPDQYKRWEHLRDLQHNDAKSAKPTNGTPP